MHITRTPARPMPVAQATNVIERRCNNEHPPLPPAPEAIAGLLRPQKAGFRFTESSYYTVEEWQPRPMDDVQARTAREFLRTVEATMEPMDKARLLTRILALLSHYRSDPNPPEVEYAIAEDWAEDLGEFPGWSIEEACRQWRRTNKFRPQICEIREACERISAQERILIGRLRRLIEFDERRHDPVGRCTSQIVSNLAARLTTI